MTANIEDLSHRIMLELSMKGLLAKELNVERLEHAAKICGPITHVLQGGDLGKTRHEGIPDRHPDFAIWVDATTRGAPVVLLPTDAAVLLDWELAAAYFMHQTATEICGQYRYSYPEALKRLLQRVVACETVSDERL